MQKKSVLTKEGRKSIGSFRPAQKRDMTSFLSRLMGDRPDRYRSYPCLRRHRNRDHTLLEENKGEWLRPRTTVHVRTNVWTIKAIGGFLYVRIMGKDRIFLRYILLKLAQEKSHCRETMAFTEYSIYSTFWGIFGDVSSISIEIHPWNFISFPILGS